MALADTARLIASLELDPRKFTKGLSNAEKSLGKMESRAYRTGQHIGIGIKNVGRLGLAAAGSISAISIASLKVAGDFEEQLNTINTIAHKTPAELEKVGDAIRGIAKDTGTPLEELTQGYYDLLSAGIQAAGAQKVLVAANKLAIGGLASTAETVDLLTTAINTYGLHSRDAAKIADIFAKAVERGKVTAAELAASFATVGPIAASAGVSIEEVSAAYARLTSSGVPAAEAATQTRAAIQSLAKMTPALKKLEKQTGKNYLALAGKKGLVFALETMRNDAKKNGVPLTDLTGRIEAQSFILQTTGPNFKKYNADLKAMGGAAGTAAAQMAERQKGLNFQLAKLKSLAKDAGITIGSELLPRLTPLFDRINKAFADPKTQEAIRDFGDKLAGLFSDQNIKTGVDALKGAFQAAKEAAPILADSLKISGAALKIAVDAFKSLPPDVQKLAIAALAVNKLTGGLVTTLAGGLVSAVVKQVLGGFSGAMNVTAGVVTVNGAAGAVPGAGGAAGAGGAGKLGTALKVLGGITIIGAAAAIADEVHSAIAAGPNIPASQLSWPWGPKNTPKLLPELFGGNGILGGSGATPPSGNAADRHANEQEKILTNQYHATQRIEAATRQAAQEEHGRGERLITTGKETRIAIDASKARLAAAMAETSRETSRGAAATAAAARAAGQASAEAIRRKNLTASVNVNNVVRVNNVVSIRDTAKKLSFSQNMAVYG